VIRRAVVAWLGLLLSACASAPISPDSLSGRLAVQVEGAQPRSVSAAFELRGDAGRGEMSLSTPLGNMLARARWQAGDVRLETPDGERRFDDLDALARETLGEAVPVVALFDWLRGRPWPGAPSRPLDGPSFAQLGWIVDLSRYDDGLVDARRVDAPVVVVRARLDATR